MRPLDQRNGAPNGPWEAASTEEVVARAAHDREGAFADLYGRIAPAVFTWASLHLQPALRVVVDPEDVLQEVACRAYEGFEAYDPRRGDFRGWVFGIARNVLYQALDRRRSGALAPAPLADLPDTATSVTSRVARNEQVAAFLTMVERLPADDRRLLSYRGLEGLSHEKVGELMNLGTDAVMQRWSRLLARLRERGCPIDFVAA